MSKKRILLLGMVYSDETRVNPSVGQEFRDRKRCISLEECGYNVYSMDDKHSTNEAVDGHHCKGNFCDTRRFMKWIKSVWNGNAIESDSYYGDYKVDSNMWNKEMNFNVIVLDYFFSPNSWSKVRWSETLFTESIPSWATNGMLAPSSNNSSSSSIHNSDICSSIWLPNVQHVDEMIQEHIVLLSQYYTIYYVQNPLDNPLYYATNQPICNAALMNCHEVINNETQLPYLQSYSDTPFIQLVLKPKDDIAQGIVSTNMKRKRL